MHLRLFLHVHARQVRDHVLLVHRHALLLQFPKRIGIKGIDPFDEVLLVRSVGEEGSVEVLGQLGEDEAQGCEYE